MGLRSLFSSPEFLRRLFWLAASLAAAGLAPAPAAAQTSRPNVVVILSDDAGYSDFGFSRATSGGTSQFQTPNLDALAQRSIVASQGYVSSPLCGPSRAGLLTGQYQQRLGIEDNMGNNINQPFGFDGDETLLSHRLKNLGYSTGMIGKWHLGYGAGVNRPTDMGFDEYYGFLSGSRSYYQESQPANLLYRNTTNVESVWRQQGDASEYDPLRGRYLTDAFGEESVDYINRHAQDADPFFLYAAFTAPHTPLLAKQADLDQFADIADVEDRTLAAMVYALDRNVGKIVDALNVNGIRENTIVVFANDNGGPAQLANNLPFRDYKGKTHEGGIRVPFFINMPGMTPGMTYDAPISTFDLVPTLVKAAGGTVPASETAGVDLAPYLSGANPDRPHELMFWRSATIWAVRKGDWKLARPHEPQFTFRGLYNLADDPHENVNLITQQPDVAAELYRELTLWEATLAKPENGPLGADDRNRFDHFVFNGAAGAATNWNAAAAWVNPAVAATPVTMRIDDAYANAILEFKVRQTGSYTAANNMNRMSGLTYMLNEMRLTDEFSGATNRSATINGNALLFVKNLAGQGPRIQLGATSAPGAASFTFNVNNELQLLDDLEFYGNGTQVFTVGGAIRDYYQPRGIKKSGTSKLTLAGNNSYRGATVVQGGELILASGGAAINGSSLVTVGAGAKLTLTAGLIRTTQLSIAPQGAFSFTGGTLQATTVSGNLVNAGGVFAGGVEVGAVDILGNFTQSSGKLLIDVGASAQGALFDRLNVTGSVTLGGTLDVDLLSALGGEFTPTVGANYKIISASGGITGNFSQLLLPSLPETWSWSVLVGTNSVRLSVLGPPGSSAPAPYDAEGLAIWRQNYGIRGGATAAQADWNEDGDVDGSDLLIWQNLSSAPTRAIPEPSTAALLLAGLAGVRAATSGPRRRMI